MNTENHNEEIDLKQLLNLIKESFRSLVRLIISVILFYKSKAILFAVVLVLGGVIGFFVDKYRDTGDDYAQEIIIEPKHNTARYIYDFVTEFENNAKDESFLKRMSANPSTMDNLKEISIEPIIRSTDVLDNLEERYDDKEFFKSVIEAYDDDELKDEKFTDFYRHHKITIKYRNGSSENVKITSSILDYIKSNDHYKKEIDLVLKQTKEDIEQNKKTLQFINQYLLNLGRNPLKSEKEVVVITDEEQPSTMTIASLLQQKESLMETINDQERILTFNKEVFSIIDYGKIISKKKVLLGNKAIMIPLVLFGMVSLFFFFKHLFKRMNEFAKA
ncbi:hypothetical protein [Aquimarina mytili]|uniref:Uncharacterized protein n=1 Tax=Aquimarina mytili TaxID=874423 RepID=A0A937DC92_9FLAO|nr:hypothetical protein [Aquimarina mytili]MBL0684686.1 hypothetical protein [Aquimarina mytili]